MNIGIKFKYLIALLVLLLLNVKAYAVFQPQNVSLREAARLDHKDSFLGPNETQPEDALEILKNAPKGVYVAVGTERGFIASSLTPQANSLILADVDSRVVFYNQVNRALLIVAKDRLDYKRLRMTNNFEDWKTATTEFLTNHPDNDGSLKDLTKALLDYDYFRYWFSVQRGSAQKFYKLLNSQEHFVNSSYLKDDNLYFRLQFWARKGLIYIVQADLKEHQDVQRILSITKELNQKISVLDISNAWTTSYLGDQGLSSLIFKIRNAMRGSSIVLMTEQVLNERKSYNPFSIFVAWKYLGINYANLFEFDTSGANLNLLIKSLMNDQKSESIPGFRSDEFEKFEKLHKESIRGTHFIRIEGSNQLPKEKPSVFDRIFKFCSWILTR